VRAKRGELTDSSAVCMRAVAATLRGEFPDVYGIRPWQRPLLRLIALLGRGASLRVIEMATAAMGVPPSLAESLTTEELAQWAVSLYDDLEGPFDAILIGAPNGGVANIAAALRAPFLSQHFLISFRDPTHPDDIAAYQEHGQRLARAILTRNPDVAVINHYDPVHDRFLVRHVNHIRLKLLSLPRAYREFILARLRPGGTIVFVDCRYPWLQYRVDERLAFQVGGLGGISPEEFIEGRPEIEALRGKPGGWSLDLPLEKRPESEWGTLPPLREVCEEFAARHGYRFVALEADHPERYSLWGFEAHRRLSEKEGREPQGVLVETFTQISPIAALRSRLLPLWLPFNCTDSLAFLRKAISRFPPTIPVLFTPFANFVITFDLVPLRDWLEVFEGRPLITLGMNLRLYPCDPTTLYRREEELAAWCATHPDPVRASLSVEELLQGVCAGGQGPALT